MALVLPLAGPTVGGGVGLVTGCRRVHHPLIAPPALPMLLTVGSGMQDVDEDAVGAEVALREIRVEVPAWS